MTTADGNTVGKIYRPYVEELGTEIELEWQDETGSELIAGQSYRVGLGKPLGTGLFGEFSLLAERKEGGDTNIEGYEAELIWQLTEQGEYAADYGLMLELERGTDADLWEAAAILLVSRDIGRFTGTINAALEFEEGETIKSEWETSLALQWRYRWRQELEPALEYFKGEDTNALGPVISGKVRIGVGRSWRWELGVIFGLNDKSVDRTLKARLEYEF